jgi:hypothetical protein
LNKETTKDSFQTAEKTSADFDKFKIAGVYVSGLGGSLVDILKRTENIVFSE